MPELLLRLLLRTVLLYFKVRPFLYLNNSNKKKTTKTDKSKILNLLIVASPERILIGPVGVRFALSRVEGHACM
jgi:hypothetical protein